MHLFRRAIKGGPRRFAKNLEITARRDRPLDRVSQGSKAHRGKRCSCRRTQSGPERRESGWIFSDAHGAEVRYSCGEPLIKVPAHKPRYRSKHFFLDPLAYRRRALSYSLGASGSGLYLCLETLETIVQRGL